MIDGVVKDAANATVTIRRCTSPVFDANDVLDDGASTFETETVPAIVSLPNTDAPRRVEGRIDSASLQATVPSGTDVATNRSGIKDEVDVDGRTYRVQNVETVDHPFADSVVKKTLQLEEKGGR